MRPSVDSPESLQPSSYHEQMRRLTIPHLRWVLAAMLCFATMINYIDRLAIAIVSVDIRRALQLTETDYSHILTIFMFAYAIMYAGSGYVVDRL